MKRALLGILIVGFSLASCHRGERVGAVCEDGWASKATGQGACSHHGGVDHWVYKSDFD